MEKLAAADTVSEDTMTQSDIDELLEEASVNPRWLAHGSRREDTKVNEFLEGGQVLPMTFPHVFMRGQAFDRPPGKLSKTQRRHMLDQFTLVAAKDRRLICYLCDSLLRFEAICGVNASLKNDPHAAAAIRELLESPEEQGRLKAAIDNPDTKDSMRLLRKYLPHLRFAGKDISYGSMENFKLQSYILESAQRYQPPTEFVTLNFATGSNPLVMRMSHHTVSNQKFPAVFEQGSVHGANGDEFMQKLATASTLLSDETFDLSHTHSARIKMAIDDPVSVVKEQMRLINDVCSILLGLTPENFFPATDSRSRRKTVYFEKMKGVCGHPLSFTGVTEDDSKGNLHFHLLFFGGLSPYILQRFPDVPSVARAIAKVLDSFHQSKLPTATHVSQLIPTLAAEHPEWNFDTKKLRSRLGEEPLLQRTLTAVNRALRAPPGQFQQELESCTCHQRRAQEDHHHMNTCHEGTLGITGCRLCMKAGECLNTHAVRLDRKGCGTYDDDETMDDIDETGYESDYEVWDDDDDDDGEDAFAMADERLYELGRARAAREADMDGSQGASATAAEPGGETGEEPEDLSLPYHVKHLANWESGNNFTNRTRFLNQKLSLTVIKMCCSVPPMSP